jgi:uncharacterized protein (DUF927 family)
MNDLFNLDALHQQAQRYAKDLAQKQAAKGFSFIKLHCYTDQDGTPIYWKIRLKNLATGKKLIWPISSGEHGFVMKEPEDYKAAYPDGNGKKPLYALDRISQAPADAEVWIFEGEQKADLANDLGLCATTCGGSQSINRTHLEPLAGRKVVIWPDNDEAGTSYLDNLGEALTALGCKVQTIELEPLELPQKGDVVDWVEIRIKKGLNTDRSDIEALERMLFKLPEEQPAQANNTPNHAKHLAEPMKWEDGHFHILEDGIFFIDEDKNGNQYKRFISSPILVIAKTRDDTSNNWGVLLQWLDDNKVKHTQALSMELFQTDGAELRKALAYQGVTISTNSKGRNLFSDYLANYPTAMRALCVDRVGWHGEVFVLPHERIGQSSNGDLIVYQANHGLDNRYQSKGTLEQWRNDVAQLVQKHSRLVFALCTAFSGQLLDPLNQQGGGFHIKGGSSKGKSTALNLACSVWGNPKHFYRTWRATGNALEHTAYMHNDSFLVLDEIGEIANPKELGNIVYMLSNGLGKGRMTKQITAKPVHQWKIIFLSSGEKSLKEIMQEQGQKTKLGQEIRLADIDIDESEYGIFDCLDFAEDGAKQSIELASRLNQSYGVAGIAWLNYLTSNKAERIGEARELLDQYRQALTVNQSQGHIVRVANYFALVATAGEMATSAGITGWEAGTAFNAVQMVFNQWLGGFDQIGNFEDREILAQVKAFFEANGSSRFECITPDPIHPEKINNRAGYWKIEGGEKVYLVFSEQFKKEICKGFDYRKVAKVLKANQWINCNAKEYQKSERIPDFDKPMRMYVFNGAMWSWHDNENSHNSIRNIRNTRNSLDTQGFQPLRNTKIEYVTHVTKDVTANPMPDPVTYSEPVTYCENQTRNTANPSNDGLVTAVTSVTSKNNGVRDLLGEPVHPEPAKQEQPAPKKQAKAKLPQPEPVPANDDTLDLFGGML